MRNRARHVVIALALLLAGVVPAFGQASGIDVLHLMKTGKWKQAEESLGIRSSRQAGERQPPLQAGDILARRLGIELLERRGNLEDARAVAEGLLQRYRAGAIQDPALMGHAAFAAWHLQKWEEANKIFLRASELPGAGQSLYVDWGNLYLEKFNPSEAQSIFEDGLKVDPAEEPGRRWNVSDLYLGLAQALKEQSAPGSAEALSKAEEADPKNPEIAVYKAYLALQDEDAEKAGGIIEDGLSAVPDHLGLMEISAAAAYFSEETRIFQKKLEELEKINPRDGKLFELLGDLCVLRRRLDDSVANYSRALELEPDRWTALASRGINRLRMGEEESGVADLERAYENDPYNIWTVNTLRLVDSFANFRRLETDHFSLKLNEKEADVLEPYVEDLLERSLSALETRFGHQVDHRVVFEMYPDHEDFAVRTLGLPGLGALGATFGRVVAMDSPTARPKGEFHWGSTLWHEMAHVVTLSLSRDRVPRWFTEGLSMMEERRGGPGWGDPVSVHFVRAWEAGKLLPIADLNQGFVHPDGPEQITNSYFQAGWICELMEHDFGMDKIRAMLEAYGTGKTDDEVFKEVLGITTGEMDRRFNEELQTRLAPLAETLKTEKVQDQSEEGFRQALAQNPDNFFLNLALGSTLVDEGKPGEGVEFLEKARTAFPDAVEAGGPYDLLSRAYLKLGDTASARRVLTEWWNRHPVLADTALQLVKLLLANHQDDEAREVLEQAMYADPFTAELHDELGKLYYEEGAYAKAVREYKTLLALNPPDEAGARYQLARAFYGSGSREQARLQVLLALEIAPTFEDAQKLLLEIARK